MGDEKKSDKITVTDLSMKDFGPALVNAAKKSDQEQGEKAVVRQIQGIMADIRHRQQLVFELQECIALQRRRLEALNAGEFTIEYSLDERDLRIEYQDPRLERFARDPLSRQGPIFSGVVHR